MNPRYLLLIRRGESDWPAVVEQASEQVALDQAFVASRLALFVAAGGAWHRIGDEGCVVGSLFHRHGSAKPILTLDSKDAKEVEDGRNEYLLDRFWGGYVAAFAGREPARLFRDPSGALPCYFVERPGYVAIASDAEILADAGFAAEVDWDALARHFMGSGVPVPETALRGMRELLPGFAIDLGAPAVQLVCWCPWDHVEVRDEDEATSAERLERIVDQCIHGWTAGRGCLLVSVSGGLDSSIVAAGLARGKAEAICLTMFGQDRSGDERTYARELANHLGLALVEREYRIEDIEIDAPLGPHLPRPKDRTHALAYERAHLAAADEAGAGAFVTGNGGDSVFGYSQSAAAVADRFLVEGFGTGSLRSLRDVCRQTGCSFPEAALGAWRIVRGPRRYTLRKTPLFLHPERLTSLASASFDHSWLEAPQGALPGKAAHIAAILRVQQCFEPHRSRFLPVISPLMSQPIMEACLAIPTWQWRAGGRDRALARLAFANRLPATILNRRVKGGPDGFAARLLDAFRAPIRERLLDGELAQNRIVDRAALEEALSPDKPVPGEQRVRILEFLAAEAWVRSWTARAPGSRPGG
jgi:asparagine synthase (glutamine-hydrolysing)